MRAARLALPAAIVALIWALSSQSAPGPDLGRLQAAGSVVAHLVLYAALWTSLAWALGWQRPVLALVLTGAYGAVDEVHQSFVDGRGASALDLAVDIVAAGLAWAVTTRLRRSKRPGAATTPAPPGAPARQHSR